MNKKSAFRSVAIVTIATAFTFLFSFQIKAFGHTNAAIPMLKIKGAQADTLTTAYQIAMGDIFTSIRPYKDGLLKTEMPVLAAGVNYPSPWTRDAGVTVQLAGAQLFPDIAKNTLVSMLTIDNQTKKVRIGQQYWDSPIWTIGAWQQYLLSDDKEFLKLSLEATINQLQKLEFDEFEPEKGLFRGGSFFQDGVSAYPDVYAQQGDKGETRWNSGIEQWVDVNPGKRAKNGFGLPMMALSTNCIYYKAYTLVDSMATVLKKDISWFKASQKAAALKQNINKHFWNNTTHKYLYLVDPLGNCDYQEGAGIAMAILFGVADRQQAEYLFANTHIEPAGLPCIYPAFPRYSNAEKTSYGRHSGTIWPQVNGYWVLAAAKYNKEKIVDFELRNLAHIAVRDCQFYEILHPVTGLPYGGMQETTSEGMKCWDACKRQTWCATAYVSMMLNAVAGMNFNTSGVTFNPIMTGKMQEIKLTNIVYRHAVLNLKISGTGSQLKSFRLNGVSTKPFIPANATGNMDIEITMY